MQTFTKKPRARHAKKVWIGARFLIGGPPSSMTMIPSRTRFRGGCTTTTKWIIKHGHPTLISPIEIDGPSGQVYDALLKMTRDEQ
jgi:hypothetical protein